MNDLPSHDRSPDHRDPGRDDEVLRRVAGLTRVDVDPGVARQVRDRSLAALAAGPRSRVRGLARWIEPALVVGLVASYLAWAVNAALVIYR